MILNGKTYSFDGNLNGMAVYTERSAGIPAGYSPLTTTNTVGKGARGTNNASRSRSVWKLSLPVVATDDSACVCTGDILRQTDVNVDIRSDANSTTADLTELLARFRALVLTPQFEASFLQHLTPTA